MTGILVSGQDSGGLGGAENFLEDLATSFRNLDTKVAFTTYSKSDFTKRLKKNKFKIFETPVRMDIIGDWKGFLKFIFFLVPSVIWNLAILMKAKNQGFDTILLSGFTDKIIISKIAKKCGYKLIWLDFAPLDSVYRKNFGIPKILYFLVKDLPNLIVVPTENTKKYLVKGSKFNQDLVKVIPCGIDIKKFIVKKKRKEFNGIIGTISRIEKGKGQDMLIKAFSIFKKTHPKSKLIIVGTGEIQPLIELARKENVIKDIEFTGYIENTKMLPKFDIFCFPSVWKLEGFGIVALEAMAAGIPLIASNFGPIPEVVGDAGILVKPTPEGISLALNKIFRSSSLRERLIETGLKRVKNYDINKIAYDYLRNIKEAKY